VEKKLKEAGIFLKWKKRAEQLKTETYTLFIAFKDPRVPWYAKVFVGCIVGYAFSPIDLIPDFIPVLGYLDDLILLPLGITLALRMIPAKVLKECRTKAKEILNKNIHKNWTAALVIITIWLLIITFLIVAVVRIIKK